MHRVPASRPPPSGKPSIRRANSAQATKQVATAKIGLAAAAARGEAAKVEWVTSGEVIPAKTLAGVWGLTPKALRLAADLGEVFAVVVKRQRYFPKEFLELNREEVGAVSKALGSLSPSEKLIFWKRPHGALGGKTVLQLLGGKKDDAQLGRVTQLAQAWAAEAQAESKVCAQGELDALLAQITPENQHGLVLEGGTGPSEAW